MRGLKFPHAGSIGGHELTAGTHSRISTDPCETAWIARHASGTTRTGRSGVIELPLAAGQHVVLVPEGTDIEALAIENFGTWTVNPDPSLHEKESEHE